MNTADDSSENQDTSDFKGLQGDDDDNPKKDDALAALGERLQAEKDARMEERFIWVVACVILIDVIWLRTSPNPTFPIVILILELVALLIIARRMGVNDFVKLMDRILYGFAYKSGGAS